MEESVILPELPTYLFAPSLAGLLSLVLVVVLPLGAGLLMRAQWSTFQKGLVLLGLSAVKAYVEAWIAADQTGHHFNHVLALYALAVNFLIAVAVYFGVLRNTVVQRAALASGVRSQAPYRPRR